MIVFLTLLPFGVAVLVAAVCLLAPSPDMEVGYVARHGV